MNQKAFSQDFTENLLREQGIVAENHSGFGGKTGEELAKALLEQDIPYGKTEKMLRKLRHLLVETFSISHRQQKKWMIENLSDAAIGSIACIQGLHKTAVPHLQKVIDALPQDDESNKNVYTKARLLNLLGISLQDSGEYTQAGILLDQGLTLADKVGARFLHWVIYHNIGLKYANTQQYELAQECFSTIIDTIGSDEYDGVVEKAYRNYVLILENQMENIKKEKNAAVKAQDMEKAAACRDKEKELGKLCDAICEDYIEYLREHTDNPEVQDIISKLNV